MAAHCAHAAGAADSTGAAPCTDVVACDPECGEGFTCTEGACVADEAACVSYTEVKAVFDEYGCTGCHGGSGGFTLSTYDDLIGSGNVVLGDHGSSILWLKLKGNGGNMPLNSKTVDPATDMKVIEAWIDGGAVDTCE